MAKVQERIGNLEVPAENPGWFRQVGIVAKRDPKTNSRQTVAAYTTAIETAFRAHRKLIRDILKAKPVNSWPDARTLSGVEFITPGVGYITLYDVDRNGKWDWVIIGKGEVLDNGRVIHTTRSVELITDMLYGGEERPLVEKAIDRSMRKMLGPLLANVEPSNSL